jgi:hypothetical protein
MPSLAKRRRSRRVRTYVINVAPVRLSPGAMTTGGDRWT